MGLHAFGLGEYKMKEVSLELRSWKGMSIGAIHYYGSLVYYDENRDRQDVDVQRVLTERQAKELNEYDDYDSYRVGDESGRFMHRQDVIDVGIAQAKKMFGDELVLRLNAWVSAQLERTLYAPERILAELKPIEDVWFETWDDQSIYDPWTSHKDTLTPLNKAWMAVNKKYGLTSYG